MAKCEECDKKLRIFRRYPHPALGKRFPVCSNCYDMVSRNMEKWSKFCLSDSNKSYKIYMQEEWNKSLSNDVHLQKWFDTLWIKFENNRNKKRI